MPHHVQVTVPPEHAVAVHEALVSVYGRAAGTLADAAATGDPERMAEARAGLLDADTAIDGFGHPAGVEATTLGGSGLLVHRVLGAALGDAAGTVALRLDAYEQGEVALDAVAGAVAALGELFALWAAVERRESV